MPLIVFICVMFNRSLFICCWYLLTNKIEFVWVCTDKLCSSSTRTDYKVLSGYIQFTKCYPVRMCSITEGCATYRIYLCNVQSIFVYLLLIFYKQTRLSLWKHREYATLHPRISARAGSGPTTMSLVATSIHVAFVNFDMKLLMEWENNVKYAKAQIKLQKILFNHLFYLFLFISHIYIYLQ